jgi:ubiquinone/menaquinone biosynthesis C-methylase UbiE
MAFANPQKSIEQFGLSEGMEVADFGAGAGYVAVEAAEQVGREGKVYVIDIQRDLLTKATHIAKEHHLESLVFIHGDLETPLGSTLPNASVDAVIISNLLFQVTDKRAVLVEARRILRPGGRVLIVDWRESFGGMGPQPELVVSEGDARELLQAAKLVYESSVDVGTYHYGLICKKNG